jgi:iron complex outermembrane receptor protein
MGTRQALMCASAGIALWLEAGPATAQSEGAIVGEVIVTAQKREEVLQDVAGAVSALGADAIEQRGIRSVQDLQYQTPSLQAGTGFNSTVIFLRGVGQTVGQPGVATHVDGVYQARNFQTALAQTDLARIEVLRGPQGTLYGRNATAGAVNFVTQPPTGTFEGWAKAGYGNFESLRLQGVVNVPLSDRLRARFVLDYADQNEGFIKNVIPGNPDLGAIENLYGRARLQFDATDRLILDLTVFGLRQEGVGDYLLLHNLPTAASIARNPYLANVIVPFEPHRTSANRGSDRTADAHGATLTATWDVGELRVKSTTGYYRFSYTNDYDADGTQLDIFPSQNRLNSWTLTQEVTLSGRTGQLDWLVGGYALDDEAQNFTRFGFPLGLALAPGGSVGPLRGSSINIVVAPYKTTSYAAFADGTFHVNERLRVIVGARYSEEKQERLGFNGVGPIGIIPTGAVLLPISGPCAVTGCFAEAKFHSFTPRGGVQFDIDADKNVYAIVSKGFKSGGINAAPAATPYLPEKLLAYEAGLKMRLADRRVIFNATAFYYDYTDFQLNQIVGLVGTITNASAASVKGLEFETAWSPDDNWTFNANLSLLDARYDAFLNTDGLDPARGLQDLSGNRLNYSPKASGNVGVQYQSDPRAFGRLTARAELYLSSKLYFREFNLPLDRQDGYGRLNLSLTWDSPDERYSARAWATNVTDEAILSTMGTSDNFGARFINWAPPRQFGLELTGRF